MSTDHICDICMQSKIKKLPFPNSCFVSKSCFDLVHIDIWGPTSVSLNGSRYFFNCGRLL